MLTPPLMNSASMTLMRWPSRTTWLVTSTREVRQAVHVHCQPRGHELIAAVALLDLERQAGR